MIELKNVVDGFNVVLGSWLVHFAAFLTLILAIRKPPEYENDEKTTHDAKMMFSALVIFHLVLGFVRFHSINISMYFWDSLTPLMIAVVILTCFLCDNWIYSTKNTGISYTLDQ